MDLGAVLDELYGLPPGEFTAARHERAKAARAAGDRELAARIRRLRRPTLAAWVGNLLVREQPDEVERLLELGAALRQAHQDLDGGQLRELSAQQHRLTFALARQAGRLAAKAGQRIGDDTRQEVQDTLHAVLADPEAAEQWAEGSLTKPLSAPVGFPASLREPETAPATRRTKPAGEVADLDAARVRRREQQERLDRARQQAADAERELHDREGELAAAKEEQSRAEEAQQRAERRVAELSRQLEDAEREQRAAGEVAHKARDHTRDVDRTVREARRRAGDAAAHARKLAERTQRKAREKDQG
ncbi:hypothetical protein [Streptomyces sp. NPDC001292]|uniref:hypothetical protein n=1 Tax=Streptomyces sp. NPDC001292 TaxID=3364558 RepID=UPI0036A825C2